VKNIDVVVVVSGVPRPGTVTESEKLHKLVKEVLVESGDAGRAPDEFELRTESGVQLDLHSTAHQAGLVDGQTLFLNPRAGAGG
jgi:hypothetical protein